ncbi:hypothetical protein [Desulfosporosinus youngiae]|uniref:Uncharacterized protein n=1 Tax=Desulfosporosinus youngiae DSM 17734 TaxID=768710 RepID=H5Y287_9FIRM|nr:hypothetical protein [Desulfosporosinus youngiae]EHQ88435.1 hypothetical protein DesyoDRAFT_1267 [Desulfosporosinus youngiae DSM 17734]
MSKIIQSINPKNVEKTRCGLESPHWQRQHGVSDEQVNCKRCLINIEHEKREVIRKTNSRLVRLLELIEIYNVAGVLKEEFEAFAGCCEEPIDTVEGLITAMEEEMSCWDLEEVES